MHGVDKSPYHIEVTASSNLTVARHFLVPSPILSAEYIDNLGRKNTVCKRDWLGPIIMESSIIICMQILL